MIFRKVLKLKILLFISVLFGFAFCVFPASPWSGVINLAADAVVASGETLVIQPGTVVNFTNLFRVIVQAGGTLQANGTGQLAGQRIYFQGPNHGISLQTGSTATMAYCSVFNTADLFNGITIGSSAVVLDNVSVFHDPGTNGASYAVANCSPLLSFCQGTGAPFGLTIGIGSALLPRIYNSYLDGATFDVNNLAVGTTLRIEGNYFGGGAATVGGTGAVDASPYLQDPPSSGTLRIEGTGNPTIDGIMILASNKTYRLMNGNLSVANAGTQIIGYNVTNNSYDGNTTLQFDDALNLTVGNGGTLTCRSDTANKNLLTRTGTAWGSLILGAGSTTTLVNSIIEWNNIGVTDQGPSTVSNITIRNITTGAMTGILASTAGGTYCNNTFSQIFGYGIDTAVNCTVTGNTFGAGVFNPVRVTGGTATVSGNNINYTTNGITITGGAPSIIANSLTRSGAVANTSAFSISGGVPVIIYNTVNSVGAGAGNYAISISGGGPFVQAVNIASNNFLNTADQPKVTVNNIGSVIHMENNWWGVNPPAVANFSGAGEINFEPWLSAVYPGGVNILRKPETVDGATVVPPNNGNVSIVPATLTFNIVDIGHYNGLPNNIELFVYNAAGAQIYASGVVGGFAPVQTVAFPIPGGIFFYGNKYYWIVHAQDTQGSNTFGNYAVPSFNFTINQPQLSLTLSAVPATANAGDTVTYTIDFSNVGAFSVGQTIITAIMPDDVYFNGNITITGLSSGIHGTITVRAFSDIAGTVLIPNAYINPGPYGGSPVIITNGASFIPLAQNSAVKRIDMQITALPSSSGGQFIYQTIVK